MKKTKNKKRIVLKVFLVLAAIGVLFAIYHNIARAAGSKRLHRLTDSEKYIYIDYEKIHVYDSGEGRQTVVLLSGAGTASPVIDFKPLTELLEKEFQVIVIEYPGYGLSDETKKERTVENICDEIHIVLDKLIPEQKYILMPHSISGIYSIYYADKYPDEVTAIIGIENSVPVEVLDPDMKKPGFLLFDIVNAAGLVRLVSYIAPGLLTPPEMTDLYSAEDLIEFRRQTVQNFMNKPVKDELSRMQENGRKALDIRLDDDFPMLFFITTEDKGEFGSDWRRYHEQTLAGYRNGVLIEYEGSHYLHRSHAAEIAEETIRFIDDKVE